MAIASPRISSASAFVTNAHDAAVAGSGAAAETLAAGCAETEGGAVGAEAGLAEGAPPALGCERLQETTIKKRAARAGRRLIAHSSHGPGREARLGENEVVDVDLVVDGDGDVDGDVPP
jgi:hypothetical protein